MSLESQNKSIIKIKSVYMIKGLALCWSSPPTANPQLSNKKVSPSP